MGYHETVLGVEISAMRNDAGIADLPPVLTLSDFAEPHFGDRAIFQHEEPSEGAAGDDGHHLVDAAPQNRRCSHAAVRISASKRRPSRRRAPSCRRLLDMAGHLPRKSRVLRRLPPRARDPPVRQLQVTTTDPGRISTEADYAPIDSLLDVWSLRSMAAPPAESESRVSALQHEEAAR